MYDSLNCLIHPFDITVHKCQTTEQAKSPSYLEILDSGFFSNLDSSTIKSAIECPMDKTKNQPVRAFLQSIHQ